jgi:hypothetical protein
VLAGKSIARYGDGEFNHVRGGKNVSQVADPRLTEEITRVLVEPCKPLIVGIPTIDDRNPKVANWRKYAPGYAAHLNRAHDVLLVIHLPARQCAVGQQRRILQQN